MFSPVNSLQHQMYVKCIPKLNSPLTQNTLRVHYKNQLVNLLRNSLLVILKPY